MANLMDFKSSALSLLVEYSKIGSGIDSWKLFCQVIKRKGVQECN